LLLYVSIGPLAACHSGKISLPALVLDSPACPLPSGRHRMLDYPTAAPEEKIEGWHR